MMDGNDGHSSFEFNGTATQCRSYLKRKMALEAKLKREGRFNEASVWVHEVGRRRPN